MSCLTQYCAICTFYKNLFHFLSQNDLRHATIAKKLPKMRGLCGEKRKVKETVDLLNEEDGKIVIDTRKSVCELLNSCFAFLFVQKRHVVQHVRSCIFGPWCWQRLLRLLRILSTSVDH